MGEGKGGRGMDVAGGGGGGVVEPTMGVDITGERERERGSIVHALACQLRI